MIAGKRWAYHFVSGLECVDCRKKHGLKLYNHDGTIVDSCMYLPWDLHARINEMDVWCSACPVVLTNKVQSLGRQKHKEESARMADIRSRAQRASLYDTYTICGKEILRFQLEEITKKLRIRPTDENFLEIVCRYIKE